MADTGSCSALIQCPEKSSTKNHYILMQVDCRFPQPHVMKAQIHSWLAWQNEPGKPLGQAITKKFLDAQAPYAQQFILWIRRLFELNDKQSF